MSYLQNLSKQNKMAKCTALKSSIIKMQYKDKIFVFLNLKNSFQDMRAESNETEEIINWWKYFFLKIAFIKHCQENKITTNRQRQRNCISDGML